MCIKIIEIIECPAMCYFGKIIETNKYYKNI